MSSAVDLSVTLDVAKTIARFVKETLTVVGIDESSVFRLKGVVVFAATMTDFPTSSRKRKLTLVAPEPNVIEAPASTATVTDPEPFFGTLR